MSGVIYLKNKDNLYGDFDRYFKEQSNWLKIVNHPGNIGVNYNISSGTSGLGSSGSNSNWITSGLMPTPQKYLRGNP
jgi:hypothetical protein